VIAYGICTDCYSCSVDVSRPVCLTTDDKQLGYTAVADELLMPGVCCNHLTAIYHNAFSRHPSFLVLTPPLHESPLELTCKTTGCY